jgi:hypothetical protein
MPEQETHCLGGQLAHMTRAVVAQPRCLLKRSRQVARQLLCQVPQDA